MTAVSMQIVESFFDAEAVIRRMDVAERQRLSAGGADLRRTQRRKIKVRTGKKKEFIGERTRDQAGRFHARKTRLVEQRSRPGDPPFAHTRSKQSIRFILFGMDGKHRVISGPVKFASTASNNVPKTLEEGGFATVFKKIRGRWRRVRVPIAARPSAAPALTEVAPRFAGSFANSL